MIKAIAVDMDGTFLNKKKQEKAVQRILNKLIKNFHEH